MEFNLFAESILLARDASPQFKSTAKFWMEHFKNTDHLEITADMVDHGLDCLAKRGKLKVLRVGRMVKGTNDSINCKTVPSGQPLSGASINRHLVVLQSIYKTARQLRLTPRGFVSPCYGVDKLPENPGRIIELSREQFNRLMAASRLVRWKPLPAMIAVAASSGARKGNLEALRWQDVEFNEDGAFLKFATSKNGKPYRCAISPLAISELKKLRTSKTLETDLVFGKKNLTKMWISTLKTAKIDYFQWHGLRHVCASAMAREGVDVLLMMKQLNHSSVTMVRRYAHLQVKDQQTAINRIWS